MTVAREVLAILPQVQGLVLQRGIQVPGWRAAPEEHRRFSAAIAQILVGEGFSLPGTPGEVAAILAQMMTGIGVLQPLLEQGDLEEIIVRNGIVQVEHRGRIETIGPMAPDAHFEQVARRVADLGRRVLKGNKPYVLVDLPDGSRFTAIVPPLSVRGTAINIRVFNRSTFSFRDLADRGAFTPEKEKVQEARGGEKPDALPWIAGFLRRVAERNAATILVSGEFGAGKTTLLNAMSQHIPPDVQVAVVETFEELKIQHPTALRVVVPEDRQDFPTMDEVLNVVITRMRPDLLIVGEVVRDEAPRFLDAINLGKKAWTTIHGNSALGALYRLETKALVSGLPHRAIREQIVFGVDLVIHLRKSRSGRRYVEEIALLDGLEDGRYRLQYLLRPDGTLDEQLYGFLVEQWHLY